MPRADRRNIFLSKTQDAVLGDFSIAKVLGEDLAATQIGTPGYLAPEIWLGQPLGSPAPRSTPLARYAERLAASDVEEVALEPMLFPMYTVPMEVALKMTCVEPYEELVKKGLLVEFQPSLGKAMFVSHQWTGTEHPDPNFEQFPIFQGAMKPGSALSGAMFHAFSPDQSPNLWELK
eukprot:g29161.t1